MRAQPVSSPLNEHPRLQAILGMPWLEAAGIINALGVQHDVHLTQAPVSRPRGHSTLANPAAALSGAARREPPDIAPTRADGALLTQAPRGEPSISAPRMPDVPAAALRVCRMRVAPDGGVSIVLTCELGPTY